MRDTTKGCILYVNGTWIFQPQDSTVAIFMTYFKDNWANVNFFRKIVMNDLKGTLEAILIIKFATRVM